MIKVLVVEDDKDLSEAYRMVLEKAKYQVERAFDGKEALAKAEQFKPDLILLDLLMPIKSGKQFLRAYRRNADHPGVKIVVFTNVQDTKGVDEAYELGADKYFVKSWTGPAGLIKIVKDVLRAKP
jgi:DNA-binding response OmpR family regulator